MDLINAVINRSYLKIDFRSCNRSTGLRWNQTHIFYCAGRLWQVVRLNSGLSAAAHQADWELPLSKARLRWCHLSFITPSTGQNQYKRNSTPDQAFTRSSKELNSNKQKQRLILFHRCETDLWMFLCNSLHFCLSEGFVYFVLRVKDALSADLWSDPPSYFSNLNLICT